MDNTSYHEDDTTSYPEDDTTSYQEDYKDCLPMPKRFKKKIISKRKMLNLLLDPLLEKEESERILVPIPRQIGEVDINVRRDKKDLEEQQLEKKQEDKSEGNEQEDIEEVSLTDENKETRAEAKPKSKKKTFKLKEVTLKNQSEGSRVTNDRVTCYKCEKSYKSKMYLQRHIKETHILRGLVKKYSQIDLSISFLCLLC